MRMAYVITEMNAFSTNITFSHLCTSSNRQVKSIFHINIKIMRIKSQQKYINRYIKEMQVKYLNKEKLFLLFIF